MATKPFKRAVEEGLNQPEGSSLAGEGKDKRKRKSKPTSKKRAKKQKTKDRYAHAREDAQLEGLIPTTPEEALLPERVDPRTQTGSALPALVREALRECWATPDAAKPAIIAALLEPFYVDDVVLDENGQQVRIKPSRKMLMELAKTLRVLDQTQWERDHPADAGRAKGGGGNDNGTPTVNVDNKVGIQLNVQVGDLFGDISVIERRYADILGSGNANAAPVGDVRAHGYAESLDASQSGET